MVNYVLHSADTDPADIYVLNFTTMRSPIMDCNKTMKNAYTEHTWKCEQERSFTFFLTGFLLGTEYQNGSAICPRKLSSLFKLYNQICAD